MMGGIAGLGLSSGFEEVLDCRLGHGQGWPIFRMKHSFD
jgi:hypothetical protein